MVREMLNLAEKIRQLANQDVGDSDETLLRLYDIIIGDTQLSPLSIMKCEADLVVAIMQIADKVKHFDYEAILVAVTFVNALIGLAAKWTLAPQPKEMIRAQVDSLIASLLR